MSFSPNARRRARLRARKPLKRNAAYGARSLHLEHLEPRHMLSVTLGSLHDIQVPGGQSVLVPLTGIDSNNGALTFTSSSSDPTNVTLELVSPTSKSLKLNVSGTDKNGQAFSGTLILHLFEDLTPNTTSRIETLVGQQFYDGKQFFRVLDGFVAQNNGSTGTTFSNEIVSSLAFTSPGLIAMANAGTATSNDAQFFITAIDGAGSTDPITLARMPQFLDGNYTIFGQLVSGFDTFEKIMSVPVKANPTFSGEVSLPLNAITITSASIITDTQDAVLRVSAPASFNNNGVTITVTAKNTSTNESDTQTFGADVVIDPPFLNPVSNQSTLKDTPVNFTLTSNKNDTSVGVVYVVVDSTTFAAPANVTVGINQSNGQVTLTPAAGFIGTINLLAGVRADGADSDVQSNYDTLPFTLTVKPPVPTGLALDPSSNTGTFDGNGYISSGTPTLTVSAQTGGTVQFKLNGTVIGTAAETSSGSGQYKGTVLAGKLAVGPNSITATVTINGVASDNSTALSLIYAPPAFTTGTYVVPGSSGASQSLTVTWSAKKAGYNNELGYFIADSADGSIDETSPGDAGYAQAALSSSTRVVLFSKGQTAGASKTITLNAEQMVVFYLIQNNTTANFLAKNPTNSTTGGDNNPDAPLAYFSIQAANPDGQQHTQIIADPTTGRVQYNWEDLLNLGDSDFNDATIIVKLASQSAPTSGTPVLHAPGTGDKTDTLHGTLNSGNTATAPGDIGVFFVDSLSGAIGALNPGSVGYAAAALASANSKVLFNSGSAGGTQQNVTVPAGKYLAFYAITSGSTANFLLANSTNDPNGGPVALFSFDAANPNGIDHFRWTSPENVQVDPSKTELHIMDKIFGGESDFDDLTVDLSFTA